MNDVELKETNSTLSLSTSDESLNTYDASTSAFLREGKRNICYTCERIPLCIKLILVTVASMLGLIAFSAWLLSAQGATLTTSMSSKSYREFSTLLQTSAAALQSERDYTSLAVSYTPLVQQGNANLTLIRPKVDDLLNQVSTASAAFPRDPQIVVFKAAWDKFRNSVAEVRRQASNTSIYGTNLITLQVLDPFSAIIQRSQEVSMIACFKLASPGACMEYMITNMIAEQSSVFRAYSIILINGTRVLERLPTFGQPNFDRPQGGGGRPPGGSGGNSTRPPQNNNNTNFNNNNRQFEQANSPTARMTSALQRQNTLLALLSGMLDEDAFEFVNTSLSVPIMATTDAIQTAFSAINSSNAVNPSLIYDQLSDRIDVYAGVSNHFLNDYATTVKLGNDSAVALIIIICVCVFCCIVLACFSAFCFSQTITGPWRRLNKLQEETIAKFIPKDLLHMMKVKSIVNLPYGRVAQVQLTIVYTEIKNFDLLIEKMTPEEQYSFLNAFLNDVGPILRQFDGTIVRYLANGFVAAFRNPKKAVKASIELQRHMPHFNKLNANFPGITLMSGINTENVLIGTVGESLRMEIAVSGQAVQFARKLKKANNLYKTRMLATQDTISKFKSKQSTYRTIGKVQHLGKTITLYEILDGRDEIKKQTAASFSKAVDHMFAHEFAEAKSLLEAIKLQNPSDAGTIAQLQICDTLTDEANQGSLTIEIAQVLQDATLRTAFSKYCDQELSFENMLVWKLIQDYKVASPLERKQLVHTLYTHYIANDSMYCINVNALMRETIRQLTDKPEFDFADDLLDKLQAEIELLMVDTLKRFKHSQLFAVAFKNKTLLT